MTDAGERQMDKQVLYRKWRSQDFNEIIGQSHVVKTLKNAVMMGRVSSAYLFSGPRGTGKTSMARIMAKAINCGKSRDGMPCNDCRICRDIAAGTCMDVIEMDAASHTQVDKIREFIVEKVNFRPTEARRKIYIIDEVHKLSSFSFDALLKTIEEPPPFVTFILATTEPDKLPPTILSRCQRFDFKRIPVGLIIDRLKEISTSEGFCVEEGALNLVAQAADGALRDALVILEQAVSFSDGCVKMGDVTSLLGITRADLLFTFGDIVLDKDTNRGLEFIDGMYRDGKDLQRLAVDLLEHFRNLILVKMVREAGTILEVSADTISRLSGQAQRFKAAHILHVISELMELRKNLKETGMERILWEVSVVRLTQWEGPPSVEALSRRVAQLEKALEGGSPLPPRPQSFTPPPFTPPSPKPEPPPPVKPPAEKKEAARAIFSPPPIKDEPPAPPPAAEAALVQKAVPEIFTPPAITPRQEAPAPPPPAPSPAGAKDAPSLPVPSSGDDSGLWRDFLREVKKERFNLIPVLEETGAGKLAGAEYIMKVDPRRTFDRNILDKNRRYFEDVLGRLTGRKIAMKLESHHTGRLFGEEGKPHQVFVQEVMDMFGASPVDRPV